MFVPALPPKVTDVTPTKPVPLIVTFVPPIVVPRVGEIDVMCGALAAYVYWSAVVSLVNAPSSTEARRSSTVPAGSAGRLSVHAVVVQDGLSVATRAVP